MAFPTLLCALVLTAGLLAIMLQGCGHDGGRPHPTPCPTPSPTLPSGTVKFEYDADELSEGISRFAAGNDGNLYIVAQGAFSIGAKLVALGPDGQLQWVFETYWGDTVNGLPILSKGRGFLVGSSIYSFNSSTGKLLWQTPLAFTTPLTSLSAALSVDESVLYVIRTPSPPERQQLIAFDATTGQRKWHALMGYVGYTCSTPAAAVDAVYTQTNVTVTAWFEGKMLWNASAPCKGKDCSDGVYQRSACWRPQLSPDGSHLLVQNINQVYCFDPTSGHLKWTYSRAAPLLQLQGGNPFDVLLDSSSKYLFVVARAYGEEFGIPRTLLGLDMSTGLVRWKFTMDSEIDQPRLHPAGFLVLRSAKALLALELATGQIRWKIAMSTSTFRDDYLYQGYSQSVAIDPHQGNILVGHTSYQSSSSNTAFAVSPDGERLWQWSPGSSQNQSLQALAFGRYAFIAWGTSLDFDPHRAIITAVDGPEDLKRVRTATLLE